MPEIRVLVFGATGTGKTSLCNVLTGKSKPTNSGAKGVTAKSHIYPKFQFGDVAIKIVDTVGLHESIHGKVPPDQAALQLVDLLKNSRDGFSLLIHVAWAGRITEQHDEDYQFFVEKLTQNHIPVLLAVTGCENEHPMFSWVQNNHQDFERFAYKEIIPTCFASGGRLEKEFAPLREESRAELLRAIVQNALTESYRLYGEGTGRSFDEVLTRIWNEVVTMLGREDYRRKTNESAYALLRRIGVTEKIAKAAITHIPELVGALADKTPVPFLGKISRHLSRLGMEKMFSRRRNDGT